MKKILIIIFLMVTILASYGQTTIYYSYDAAGNRITRSITLQKSTESAAENNQIEGSSEQLGKYDIQLYPNPVKDELIVTINGLESSQQVELYLYDFAGKIVSMKSTSAIKTSLEFTNRPSGTYVLKIIIGKESTEWKIIRE
jgi:hypothetical protein